MAVVLGLHPYQTHFHHGEAQRCQTASPHPGVVQLKQFPRQHPRHGDTHAGRGQPGGQRPLGLGAVNHHAHLAQVVLGLGAPAGDPGRLAHAEPAPDHQRVGRVLAAAAGVVVLQRLEGTVGVEGVGAGEELRPGPNFTPERKRT